MGILPIRLRSLPPGGARSEAEDLGRVLCCPPQIFSTTWGPAFSTTSRLPFNSVKSRSSELQRNFCGATDNYELQVCRPGDDRRRTLAINKVLYEEFWHSSLNGRLFDTVKACALPLAIHKLLNLRGLWWTWRGSNPRPHDCQVCHNDGRC